MASVILPRVNVQANSGSFERLSTTVSGEVPLLLYNYGGYFLVTGVDNAVDAANESLSNRHLLLTTTPVHIRLDPSRTWVRSSTATANELFIIRQD